MFRASDIFGKRSGNNSDSLREKARAQTENAGEKRPADAGPTTRTWDPATGEMVDEELPEEIQEMMGLVKKPKVEQPQTRPQRPAPAYAPPVRQRPPQWSPQPHPQSRLPPMPPAPPPPPPAWVPGTMRPAEPAQPPRPQGPPALKVTMGGFRKPELNGYYSERPEQEIQGRASFWTPNQAYFIYWQRSLKRWAICDAGSLLAARGGSNPGWAYRSDARHFAKANDGWIEAVGTEWQTADVRCTVLEGSIRDDSFADEEVPNTLKVKFTGFQKQELNTTFEERAEEMIQGKASLWDPTKSMFLYWQRAFSRWALCGGSSLSSAKSGMAPGWAYRNDSKHFGEAAGGWMEYRDSQWQPAKAICTMLQGQLPGAEVKEEAPAREATSNQQPAQDGAPTISEPTREQYKMLVRRVYEEKNQAKLPDLPHLFEKYSGREKEFFAQVCDKYEADTVALLASLGAPEEPVHPEVPDLTARQYAVLVQGIYVKYNPEKLQDLARLLQKFKDCEKELYVQVCEKYGVNPTTFSKEEGAALLSSE